MGGGANLTSNIIYSSFKGKVFPMQKHMAQIFGFFLHNKEKWSYNLTSLHVVKFWLPVYWKYLIEYLCKLWFRPSSNSLNELPVFRKLQLLSKPFENTSNLNFVKLLTNWYSHYQPNQVDDTLLWDGHGWPGKLIKGPRHLVTFTF